MSTETGIPAEFKGLKVGDPIRVKKHMTFHRAGTTGYVVGPIDKDGVGIDFYVCGQCGAHYRDNCKCYVSIEFFQWGELEACHAGHR